MLPVSPSRQIQQSRSPGDDAPAAAVQTSSSAGPTYKRNSTLRGRALPKPVRAASSDLHFPVGFGPATTQDEAASPLTTFSGKIDVWARTARTEQGQNIGTAERLLNLAYKNGSESLNLEGLRLTSLPDCLGELNSLKVLNLSNNRLGKIPPLPRSLTSLDLRDNEAVELPAIPRPLRDLRVDPSVAASKIKELELQILKLRESL